MAFRGFQKSYKAGHKKDFNNAQFRKKRIVEFARRGVGAVFLRSFIFLIKPQNNMKPFKKTRAKLRPKERIIGRSVPSKSLNQSRQSALKKLRAVAIVNTLTGKDTDSKLQKWWRHQGFKRLYKEFRKGEMDEKQLKKIADIRDVERVFSLRGLQFGNWVTNEDRFNYLAALGISFFDLNQVLKFKNNNLGLDKTLGLAFGARGSRGAIAHYEPWDHIINMTRYKEAHRFKKPLTKEVRFVHSGGVGALAHEYAHFLDFFFGSRVETDPRHVALSGGGDTIQKRVHYNREKKPLRSIMEDIMETVQWDKNKNKSSAYYNRIISEGPGDYFYQRTEIFARCFEQYIAYKLKELKISNKFLTKTKYERAVYLTPTELKPVIPLFDKLIREMRKAF